MTRPRRYRKTSTKRDPFSLYQARRKLLRDAAKMANDECVRIFLDDKNGYLTQRIQDPEAVRALRATWKPFKADPGNDGTLALKINFGDKLVLMLADNDMIYELFEEVAEDAIYDAIVANKKDFLETVLNDALSGDPSRTYKFEKELE